MGREQAIAYALGEKSLPADVSPAPGSEAETTLTKREREVAALVAAGKSNKEIAADLVIPHCTAETHVDAAPSTATFRCDC